MPATPPSNYWCCFRAVWVCVSVSSKGVEMMLISVLDCWELVTCWMTIPVLQCIQNTVEGLVISLQLVAWHSDRTSVFGRRTFPVLCSTCSWWVTTYVGKPSATDQPTRPTQPFIISRSINWVVSCSRMFASSHEWRRLVNAYGVKAWCGWLERWCVC